MSHQCSRVQILQKKQTKWMEGGSVPELMLGSPADPHCSAAAAARKNLKEMSPVPPATSKSRVPGDGPLIAYHQASSEKFQE